VKPINLAALVALAMSGQSGAVGRAMSKGPAIWIGGKRGGKIDAARRVDEHDGADGYYRRPGEAFLRSRKREAKRAKKEAR